MAKESAAEVLVYPSFCLVWYLRSTNSSYFLAWRREVLENNDWEAERKRIALERAGTPFRIGSHAHSVFFQTVDDLSLVLIL